MVVRHSIAALSCEYGALIKVPGETPSPVHGVANLSASEGLPHFQRTLVAARVSSFFPYR